MEIHVHVDIPSIDRLVDLLQKDFTRARAAFNPGATVTPFIAPAEPTQAQGMPEPDKQPAVTAPAATEPVQAPTMPAGFTEIPVEEVPAQLRAEAQPAKPTITLEQILKVTAEMRDEGKLPQLKSLMGVNGPYGVKMFSQLKPEQYEAFAADLRRMGGRI